MYGENTYYIYYEDTFKKIEACIRVKNLKHINYGIKVAPRYIIVLIGGIFLFFRRQDELF